MPTVRVIIFDEQNFLERISTPEDTFLIESIDASGSDENVLKIGFLTASAIHLGRGSTHTFVSGVLSGNFITGTFYGDGSNLRGVVTTLNEFTGSITLVAGPNVTIVSGSNEIVISASISGADFDEKVKVSSNDTTSDYLFNKLIAGPNITIVEQDDSSDEKVVISASDEGEHRELDQLVHNISEGSYDKIYRSGSTSKCCYRGQVASVITWTDSSQTMKIREEQYTYTIDNKITSSLSIQYDLTGSEAERLEEIYIYDDIKKRMIISIERTGTII